jgi:polysaccharide pyruvyl transferase CsaB
MTQNSNFDYNSLPSVEEQRQMLRDRKIIASEFYRILHIGRYAFGKTDIVSRMVSALKNLGHTVFDFNTDDFKEVIHNPDRHTGGFGPIEIKLDYIKPILKQFNPQIIICNAGGYTFSEEDSNWLKEQGYILVGITLSDPDVFPSTKNFAHRFDYHATNAIQAIDMYKEVGINNTVHFPFAIDRSFIEAEAVTIKEWEADVICIGNATNREDRNRVMKYLKQFFNVRVYGTGWEIPGSFPVSGEDFFSAARAGKFHINFPGTRAGYTNLKIGVFESIANGGILCTEIFDEMEIFFEYGKEIIGYKDAEDLKNKLQYYLDHPEEAELIRRRSFHKLINHHLWESRWEDLFKFIKEDINEKKSILPDHRYAQINGLNGEKERAAKIIVQGYYGALNTGDDLILEAISRNIVKKYPNSFIMVAGFNRKNITLKQGFYSLPRTDVFRMERVIKEADLLIYGGGGLLNDYTFNNSAGIADFFDGFTHGLTGMGIIPTMANIHEVPTMYFALGVGPLENPEAKKFAKFLVNQMSVVTVRDEYSKNLLESIEGINKKIIQTSDPTYVLDYPDSSLAKQYLDNHGINGEVVTVSLRDWKDSPDNFENNIAVLLDKIIEKYNYNVIFLPYQFGKGKSDDNKIHARVQELMKNKENTFIYEHQGNYDEFLSLISISDMVISMRLHGSILANNYGVPSIGFNYDDKVLAHYQNLNIENFLLSLDFNVEGALLKAEEIRRNRKEIVQRINKNVSIEREKSAKTFEYALALLKEGLQKEKKIYRFFPREESIKTLELNHLAKELKVLQRENKILQSQVNTLNSALADTSGTVNISNLKIIDFANVKFKCEKGGAIQDIVAGYNKEKIVLKLSKQDAPRKNDFSSATMEIEIDPENDYKLFINVHSPYYKPKNKGRIKYYIIIDGKKVFSEDIAVDGNEKTLSFKVRPKSKKVRVEFKLEALRNCENWSWGSASKTTFSNLCIIKEPKEKSKGLLHRIFS